MFYVQELVGGASHLAISHWPGSDFSESPRSSQHSTPRAPDLTANLPARVSRDGHELLRYSLHAEHASGTDDYALNDPEGTVPSEASENRDL